MVLHLHGCDHLMSLPITIYSTFNPFMLMPTHFKPETHVYSIVYVCMYVYMSQARNLG